MQITDKKMKIKTNLLGYSEEINYHTKPVNPRDQTQQYSLTYFLKDMKKEEKQKIVNKEENVKETSLTDILGINQGTTNNSTSMSINPDNKNKRQEMLKNMSSDMLDSNISLL